MLILTGDGLSKTKARLKALPTDSVVYTIPEYAELETEALVEVLDPSALPDRVAKEALTAVATDGPFAETNEKAIRQGLQLSAL